MANFLNVYDPKTGELVLGTNFFFNLDYNNAVKTAKKLKVPFVYGLEQKDLQLPKRCKCTYQL